MVILISAIVGVWLGLRFKVFALIYATVTLVAIAACVALANSTGIPIAVLWATLAVWALQIGYLAGAVLSINSRA